MQVGQFVPVQSRHFEVPEQTVDFLRDVCRRSEAYHLTRGRIYLQKIAFHVEYKDGVIQIFDHGLDLCLGLTHGGLGIFPLCNVANDFRGADENSCGREHRRHGNCGRKELTAFANAYGLTI